MSSTDLYLDLMKKVLTNTLHSPEPDVHASAAAFVLDFSQHYIDGPAISMLPLARIENIQACVTDVIERGVPGDLIETGVWRGGATIFMRAILKALGVTDRSVWVADSFEGLPEPDPEKFPLESAAHRGTVMQHKFRRFAVGADHVRANFAAFGLLDEQVRFLEGWFKDTLPRAPIERLAVIRLDGDYYESTMDGLVNLYDKLSPGGYLIVDDYGEDDWTYCRRAVDEFRASRNIAEPLIEVDRRCYYWQRSQAIAPAEASPSG
jgi:hypothetical protein